MNHFTKNSTIWADQPLISALQACIEQHDPRQGRTLPEYLDHHGITLLVHEGCEQGVIRLPDGLRSSIADRARHYTAQWMMQQQAFAALAEQLDQASIDWIVLKGEALGRWLYPSSRLRMRGDVDLLVRHTQRHRAMAVLDAQGYYRTLSTGADLVFSEQQYGRVLSSDCHLAVDLHWSVSNRKVYAARLDEDTLFAASNAADPAHCLPADLAMMHSVIHRVSHHPDDIRLIWWIDLWLIWQRFDAHQQQHSLQQFVDHGLAAALLHEADAMQRWFEPLLEPAARQQLCEAVAAGNQIAVQVGGWAALKQDLSVQSWPDRFRYLSELILPSSQYMMQRYRIRHRISLPLYYLRRMISGIGQLLRRPTLKGTR